MSKIFNTLILVSLLLLSSCEQRTVINVNASPDMLQCSYFQDGASFELKCVSKKNILCDSKEDKYNFNIVCRPDYRN